MTDAPNDTTESGTGAENKPVPHIYRAVRKILAEVVGVPKAGQMITGRGQNAQVQYTFQKFDDMAHAFHKAFEHHGVVTQSVILAIDYHRWEKPTTSGKTLWTSCTISKRFVFTSLEDGSAITVECAGEGFDSSDKATAKAQTMAYKMALKEAFTLSTQDDQDPDATRPEVTEHVTNAPSPAIRQAVQEDPWVLVERAAGPAPEHDDARKAEAARKGLAALGRSRTTGDALRITKWAAENNLLGVGVAGATLAAHILAARGTLPSGPPTQQAHQTQPPPAESRERQSVPPIDTPPDGDPWTGG